MNLQPRSLGALGLLKKIRDGFLEGWYFKGEAKSRDRMRLLMCNYTSNIIANFVGGTFWTGLLLLLSADDSFIGTLSMISSAANMTQCLAPMLLERFPKRKKLLMTMRSTVYLINVLLIGLIPLCPVSQQVRLYMVGLGVLIVNLISAFASPGLSIWHIQSIPNNTRSGYFTAVTMTVGAVVAICNLLGGILVDAFAARDMQYAGLMILRGIALVLCVVELLLYSKIKEYPYENSGSSFTLKDLVTKPFKEKKYLLTVSLTLLWNITANLPGSYYTVYLLKNVQFSYSHITLINMLNVPVVLFLTPVWRKVLSKYGWFKTLYMSIFLYAVHYLLLALVTPTTTWVYPISQIYAYVFAIGINLSFTGVPYVNMPQQNQTSFLGFYSTCGNLAVLISVWMGKQFILGVGDAEVTLLGLVFTGKQLLVALTGFMEVLAACGICLVSRKVGKTEA